MSLVDVQYLIYGRLRNNTHLNEIDEYAERAGVDEMTMWFAYADVLVRTTARRVRRIEESLRRWIEVGRARVAFRPNSTAWRQARRRFMVDAGQSRRTRSYRPY